MAILRPKYNRKGIVNGYAAVFYDPLRHPKEKYVTLRTKDKRVAQRRLVQFEKQESLGLFDPWNDPVPRAGVLISEAISDYLKSRTHLRPKTLRADESTLNLFDEFLPQGLLISHIEAKHIETFLKNPKNSTSLSPSTLNTYQTRISSFLSWCVENGYRTSNPATKLARPKIPRKEKPFFSREEFERLLRTIEAHATLIESGAFKQASLKLGEVRWLIDVVELAVATGLRCDELVHLRWSWVNFDARQIVVRNSEDFIPKSKHERVVPVRGRALEILHHLDSERSNEANFYVFTGTGGNKLNSVYVSKRFKKFIRLAKLPDDYSFHTLRHTFCSWLTQEGVPLPHIKELAGHASVETTMQYVHLAPESLGSSIEKVFGDTA